MSRIERPNLSIDSLVLISRVHILLKDERQLKLSLHQLVDSKDEIRHILHHAKVEKNLVETLKKS